MNAQHADTVVSRPSMVNADLSTRQPAAVNAARESDELLDDDLEHVVGGLARIWVDRADVPQRAHGASGPNAV